MQAMAEKTSVQKIQKGSDALRSTIPPGVRAALQLQEGDEISWSIGAKKDRVIVEVSKT